jgi:hypothetical protein
MFLCLHSLHLIRYNECKHKRIIRDYEEKINKLDCKITKLENNNNNQIKLIKDNYEEKIKSMKEEYDEIIEDLKSRNDSLTRELIDKPSITNNYNQYNLITIKDYFKSIKGLSYDNEKLYDKKRLKDKVDDYVYNNKHSEKHRNNGFINFLFYMTTKFFGINELNESCVIKNIRKKDIQMKMNYIIELLKDHVEYRSFCKDSYDLLLKKINEEKIIMNLSSYESMFQYILRNSMEHLEVKTWKQIKNQSVNQKC